MGYVPHLHPTSVWLSCAVTIAWECRWLLVADQSTWCYAFYYVITFSIRWSWRRDYRSFKKYLKTTNNSAPVTLIAFSWGFTTTNGSSIIRNFFKQLIIVFFSHHFVLLLYVLECLLRIRTTSSYIIIFTFLIKITCLLGKKKKVHSLTSYFSYTQYLSSSISPPTP